MTFSLLYFCAIGCSPFFKSVEKNHVFAHEMFGELRSLPFFWRIADLIWLNVCISWSTLLGILLTILFKITFKKNPSRISTLFATPKICMYKRTLSFDSFYAAAKSSQKLPKMLNNNWNTNSGKYKFSSRWAEYLKVFTFLPFFVVKTSKHPSNSFIFYRFVSSSSSSSFFSKATVLCGGV